jgi:DNA-binding MarR family transcriptional regulator
MPDDRPYPTPPPRRSYPTPAQFDVLVLFWKYHRRMDGRTKRPSLRDAGLELNISHHAALMHILALAKRGYLEQREVWEHRGWELTPKGVKRAEQKWRLLEKRRKAREEAERLQRREAKNWRKQLRDRRGK